MYTKNNRQHFYIPSRSIASNPNAKLNTKNICAVKSEELFQLSKVMQQKFPNIYDLLGGVVGLLMMLHLNYKKSATEYVMHPDVLYDDLISEAYSELDAMVETVADDESVGEVGSSILEKEFISWEFSEFLMDTSATYHDLLKQQLKCLVDNKVDVEVTMVASSPLKNVYYIYIDKAD